MKKLLIVLLLITLIAVGSCQRGTRRGVGSTKQDYKASSSSGSSGSIFDSIGNMLFPGPADTPILTRIFNKIGFYASGIVASIVAYFSFFRKNKQRNERII